MKIGLLICDHILPEQNGYHGLFSSLIHGFEIKDFHVCDNQFPNSPNDCDCWLITGSHYSVYDPIDWIIKLKRFVRDIGNSDKPCVGVCFGHQMIGEAMGGKVIKAETGWCVGVHEFEIVKQEKWMNPNQQKVNLLMSCQDQVVKLPPNSEVLAQTPCCPVGMFKVGNRMLGIQGHPEFSKDYVRALIEDRDNKIGLENVKRGLDSLKLSIDNQLVGEWIRNFLSLK